MKMINFDELSRVFILLGSVSNMTSKMSKAWFDFSYVLVVLFKGKPKFENKQTGSHKS